MLPTAESSFFYGTITKTTFPSGLQLWHLGGKYTGGGHIPRAAANLLHQEIRENSWLACDLLKLCIWVREA